MDPRTPNEMEMLKLEKLHASYRSWPLWGLSICTSLLVIQFLVPGVFLKIGLTVMGLAVFVYWSLSFAVLKKCPRCESRMTLPKGNCTTCGLKLEISTSGKRGMSVK